MMFPESWADDMVEFLELAAELAVEEAADKLAAVEDERE